MLYVTGRKIGPREFKYKESKNIDQGMRVKKIYTYICFFALPLLSRLSSVVPLSMLPLELLSLSFTTFPVVKSWSCFEDEEVPGSPDLMDLFSTGDVSLLDDFELFQNINKAERLAVESS